jgi:hypothetical protein
MLADLLKSPTGKSVTRESTKESKSVSELLIKPQDPGLVFLFENLTAAFPEDIIAGRYPEQGMLFFSYAREREICPDGCPGPRHCCPTFVRKNRKPLPSTPGNLYILFRAGLLKVTR